MTPLPPGALDHLLQTLTPERGNPFSRLEHLTPDQLLQRRVEISGQLKTLEQERKVIDRELLEVFSDAELRFGVRAPGGWILQQRSRTTWDYASEIRQAIKGLQQQAQRDGRAEPLTSTFLVATKESAQELVPDATMRASNPIEDQLHAQDN
jgi:hypothetical protein